MSVILHMNDLLHVIADRQLNTAIYNAFIVVGVLVLVLFNIYNSKNYSIPVKKALALTILVVVPEIILAFVLHWIANGFTHWGGKDLVRVFLWAPMFAYPAARLLKLDWLQSCDYLAPCLPLFQGISHHGCIFGGCCYGYEWQHGVYNYVFEQNLFPIQPIEAFTAFAIAVIIWLRQKKNGFRVDGLSYPLMLVLFGFTRFLAEFARDNEKFIFGISERGFHALFMALVGIVVYTTLKENAEKKRPGKRKKHRA